MYVEELRLGLPSCIVCSGVLCHHTSGGRARKEKDKTADNACLLLAFLNYSWESSNFRHDLASTTPAALKHTNTKRKRSTYELSLSLRRRQTPCQARLAPHIIHCITRCRPPLTFRQLLGCYFPSLSGQLIRRSVSRNWSDEYMVKIFTNDAAQSTHSTCTIPPLSRLSVPVWETILNHLIPNRTHPKINPSVGGAVSHRDPI